MSAPSAALAALWSEYADLAEQPTRNLTLEQRRGVGYFLADTDPAATVEPFIRRWIDRIHLIDHFVDEHGRMPKTDRRRPRPTTHEQELVDVVAYFRQQHASGAFIVYQTRRLEAVPGFSWSPRDASWEAMFVAHQTFWARHGFPPSRRSSDDSEVTIGRWVAQQRAVHSRGQMRPDRAARLRTARYRVL